MSSGAAVVSDAGFRPVHNAGYAMEPVALEYLVVIIFII